MELKEIKELIELVSEKGFTEFELKQGSFKIKISSFSNDVTPPSVSKSSKRLEEPQTEKIIPTVVEPPKTPIVTEKEIKVEKDLHKIKSPIVGTFYRAPSPTSDSFVKVGSQIKPGTVLCIIEAMKLMNEIESDVGGEIVEIYVENNHPVEYGQPLFGVKVN
ncbi:MAG: acetyl-CoA carboxylase biotin carboxyl carrier protein [Blastocatellia bacterium]|nr:acetyl-CoA carboxylase biotin carboxyl carrier protein [Blastocatellia bacterium]MBL8195641.1 acetyl-CoA carboxylase biotin carboxyl carrier protein [Blastocatellia bacterium]MBN8723249.1 acetyl-CoA carboxylase biotin carboxyl carrier protein [Acidobacteriota bacterium]